MKYIIHSTVTFDTTKYLLTSIHDINTATKLSNSAGKILEELIKYRETREPVTRQHLFTIVWKNHGLEASNGNLNQQISLIRKSLNSLGLNSSAIITIPKRGFKLNDQLTIKIIKENFSQSNCINKINNLYTQSKLLSLKTNFSKQNIKYTLTLLLTAIILTMALSSYLHHKDKNNQKLYFCKQINSCNICALHPIPGLECNEYNLQISEAVQKK
ncbi:winged helix-turn-helix domain-containing protein [Blochmannia endosymbiont of Camponotus (Colobopsis) obliquus]|uniref:winged helix-turn-helix domain-containing protein n=1 Tax=Blochmannia endosymbiont of Camponotus (Colobopsis) obliquus TaxID=1505597 RepID=UPI00061A7CC7|nr:winged helix-turn-helix domain-containing protein [Blochmannia endosymbiont of Camponotus (Colobopsis) obliquus]AKC60548.1 Uncharacterized protein YqeI [Blochmannia endosymbiont of Camponotus (Colobopsis) obliquus]